MKKSLLTMALMAVLVLSACTPAGTTNPAETSQPAATPVATAEPTQAPAELIQAGSASAETDGWSVVSKYRYDIDDDGERETIRLCTDAQRDDDGEMMWDDGHNWALEMSDASNVFTLYKGYVQLGAPYFEVFEDKDGRLCVGLTVSTGAGYEIKKFVYIKDKKAFEVENVYKEDGINQLYSSMTAY